MLPHIAWLCGRAMTEMSCPFGDKEDEHADCLAVSAVAGGSGYDAGA